MNKGYFDELNKEWVVPIQDKHGTSLNLRKDMVHRARDKSDQNKTDNFKVMRLVWGRQTDLPEKVNFIAKIQWSDGDISCCLCYYIFNRYGKWAFGQFCPMIPTSDFKELYEYAKEKGIL
ncbi:MAG: hypothetical protein ABSA79_02585 [Candidatus Bathyarchaeia archaeon]|jgi:hypothetical protein